MTQQLIVSFFSTSFGTLKILHDEHCIYHSLFTEQSGSFIVTPLTRLVQEELSAYNLNPHHQFKVPFKIQGSVYQQKVCQALLAIPVGKTESYGELALKLQSSPRAIGQACKRNPLAVLIPCHRVIGKNSLGGFMGNASSLAYKKALLIHEGVLNDHHDTLTKAQKVDF